MSDDIQTSLVQHGGWIATVAVTVWGFVLRTALGRHYKATDEMKEQLVSIDRRLSVIEGRFEERDTGRYRTGHGDDR